MYDASLNRKVASSRPIMIPARCLTVTQKTSAQKNKWKNLLKYQEARRGKTEVNCYELNICYMIVVATSRFKGRREVDKTFEIFLKIRLPLEKNLDPPLAVAATQILLYQWE